MQYKYAIGDKVKVRPDSRFHTNQTGVISGVRETQKTDYLGYWVQLDVTGYVLWFKQEEIMPINEPAEDKVTIDRKTVEALINALNSNNGAVQNLAVTMLKSLIK